MAFARVQGVQNSGSGTTATVTISAATINNLLVVHVKLGGNRTLAVTDNAGTPNTYALAGGPAGTSAYMYYGVQVTGGATIVTITWTTSISWRITVEEYSGTNTSNATVFDTVALANAGSGTAAAAKLPISGANELIVAGYLLNASSGVTAGTNYALGINNTSQSTAYRLSGNTNFETAPISWTGSGTWAEVTASFKGPTSQQIFGNFLPFM